MKRWQFVFWPLGLLYGTVMRCRAWLYRVGLFSSTAFEVPTIAVGNLELGGTGKSPFIDYLAHELKNTCEIAILSRGYGRKTKGFIEVLDTSHANDVGDEPLMLKLKHPEQVVAVCENRVEGVKQIMAMYPSVNCILLDDAFQHLSLKRGYNILLTPFDFPFYKNWPLPAGRLREFPSASKRANAIVFTKCPAHIPESELNKRRNKVKTQQGQIHFAQYEQNATLPVLGELALAHKEVILITGIANASKLKEEVSKQFRVITHFNYGDHHAYSQQDILQIVSKKQQTRQIITTEKDWVKLKSFKRELEGFTVHVIPVTVKLLAEKEFLSEVYTYLEKQMKIWKR